jgi:hydrogenase maturation protease
MGQDIESVVVVACGNTLRGDDGVAWRIGAALQALPTLFKKEVIFTQQLLPEHALALHRADLAIFLDCCATGMAGMVESVALSPASVSPRIFTHHFDPASLLRMTFDLYGRAPAHAFAITVGGHCFELSEELSGPVAAAVPEAIDAILSLMPDGHYPRA